MVTRALKKFGNSRCLPLDKTLQEILGIDYDNASVNIIIDRNRIIIEKAEDFVEPTKFLLDEQKWEKFNKALEEKPKSLSSIKKLLNEPSVFDE
jgi:hypothetical protein